MHRIRGANKRERDKREQKHVTLSLLLCECKSDCALALSLTRTRYTRRVNHRTVEETSFGKRPLHERAVFKEILHMENKKKSRSETTRRRHITPRDPRYFFNISSVVTLWQIPIHLQLLRVPHKADTEAPRCRLKARCICVICVL